jgi:hypothetical protein
MLVRRDFRKQTPLLMTSPPPYSEWTTAEIDVNIVGLAIWLVGDDIWFSGRWFLTEDVAQMGVFRIEEETPVLKMVLPAGPNFDFSYMGVARHPLNSSRFALSYYSNHTAPDDPSVDQWTHPAIYLVDAIFAPTFVDDFKVSEVVALPNGLDDATYPDPNRSDLTWHNVRAYGEGNPGDTGFADAYQIIAGKTGVTYFVTDLELGPTSRGVLHLGYDGPVRVWLNGQEVFRGHGTNPAQTDQTSLPVEFQHGFNRVAIALDTNGGLACGIFLRYEGLA